MDFKYVYYQLSVDYKTCRLFARSTHNGVYEVLRLPYGIKPVTAIFKKEIEKVLKKNFRKDLKRYNDAGFQKNKGKCRFSKDSIN